MKIINLQKNDKMGKIINYYPKLNIILILNKMKCELYYNVIKDTVSSGGFVYTNKKNQDIAIRHKKTTYGKLDVLNEEFDKIIAHEYNFSNEIYYRIELHKYDNQIDYCYYVKQIGEWRFSPLIHPEKIKEIVDTYAKFLI